MSAAPQERISVSVILPCHNAATTVGRVLDDVLAASESCTSFEVDVIVVDDGSTDSTAEAVIDRPNVTLISQTENSGVCEARRRGLELARGEFVWFVDADDRIPAGALTAFACGLETPNVDVVIGSVKSVDEKSMVELDSDSKTSYDGTAGLRIEAGPEALRGLLRGDLRGQLWDKLIRRRLLDSSAFNGTRVHSDIPIAAAALAGSRNVVTTDGYVYVYTVRPGSIIGSSRRRAPSILASASSVLKRAEEVEVDPQSRAYFQSWFVGLSLYRDIETSDYSKDEVLNLQKIARDTITWQTITASIQYGAWRRAVSLSLSLVSGSLFLSVRKAIRVQRSAGNGGNCVGTIRSIGRNGSA